MILRYTDSGGIQFIEVKIKPDFKPLTKNAIKYVKLSSGNYKAIDRGADSDTYEADVRLYGKESDINTLIDFVEDNRSDGTVSNQSVIGALGFAGGGEEIFGKDVDHSGSFNLTVLDIGPRRQNTWKGWELPVRFRALNPTFNSYTSALPPLEYLEVGYKSDSDPQINKFDTYDGDYSYQDHVYDSGIFEGTFKLSNENMGQLRRYIATNRGNDYTISSINGVTYPFGSRRGTTFPVTAKLIDWDDLGQWGLQYWRVKLRFAEVV